MQHGPRAPACSTGSQPTGFASPARISTCPPSGMSRAPGPAIGSRPRGDEAERWVDSDQVVVTGTSHDSLQPIFQRLIQFAPALGQLMQRGFELTDMLTAQPRRRVVRNRFVI